MKKLFVLFLILAQVIMANAQVKVNRIDPANWFVGMKNPSLQLMVYGPNIKSADVSVDYPGVRVDSVVRLQAGRQEQKGEIPALPAHDEW